MALVDVVLALRTAEACLTPTDVRIAAVCAHSVVEARQRCAVVDILSAGHTHIPKITLAQVAGQLVRAPASIPARS